MRAGCDLVNANEKPGLSDRGYTLDDAIGASGRVCGDQHSGRVADMEPPRSCRSRRRPTGWRSRPAPLRAPYTATGPRSHACVSRDLDIDVIDTEHGVSADEICELAMSTVGESGKHILVLRIAGYDPQRTRESVHHRRKRRWRIMASDERAESLGRRRSIANVTHSTLQGAHGS
jgi:hypothetical protein